MIFGFAEILLPGPPDAGSWWEIAGFLRRIIGTCAVFYILFLCRMLGAGDIKLMALCNGILGMEDGISVIFLGLMMAAVRSAYILYTENILWARMMRLAGFVISFGRDGKLREYPGRQEKKSLLHLGPYLFTGYCVWLILRR